MKNKIILLMFIASLFSACGAGVEFKDLNGRFQCIEGCVSEDIRCQFPSNITVKQTGAALELSDDSGFSISLSGAVNESNSIYLNDSTDLCSFTCGGSVAEDEINLDCISAELVNGNCKLVYPYCQIARYQRVSDK